MNKAFTTYCYIFMMFLTMDIILCEPLKVGDKAPEISLMKLENKEYFKSEALLGEKNLVICFFSTWSRPFNNIIPKLIKVSKDFDAHSKFLLVSVSEKKPLVKNYVSKRDISLQVIMDKFGKTFKKFGGDNVPLLVVVDKNGLITHKVEKFHDGYEIELIEHLKSTLD